MNYKPEDLPFRLDKTDKASLTDQLADGIRQAVADGKLKEGDHLPSREEIAGFFGVSLRVPRMAFQRLKADGVILTRPRLGCVVARPSGRKKWKGTVLFVRYEVDANSYNGSTVETEARRLLEASGYTMLTAGVRQKTRNSFDFSVVERYLEFSVSLIIVSTRHPAIRRWVARTGVPYIAVDGACGEGTCVGAIPVGTEFKAHRDFVAQCVARGIRRVLQVGFLYPGFLNLKPFLTEAGVDCDVWTIAPVRGLARFDGITQAALRAFVRRFEKEGKGWLPDLILFADDFVASGALAAFAAFGVRAPEDVRIVSLVNEGNRIPYAKRLALFVSRPKVMALRLARTALAYLNKRQVPAEGSRSLVYERGETFP